MFKKLAILLVLVYQNTLSLMFPSSCRYSPSCSNYSIQSFEKYGFFKGLLMTVKRVGRCHPCSKHNTWDPVK